MRGILDSNYSTDSHMNLRNDLKGYKLLIVLDELQSMYPTKESLLLKKNYLLKKILWMILVGVVTQK